MNRDPAGIISQSRMSMFQITAVVVCVLLNGLDGFDVASISFASNGIAAEFGLNPGAFLGTILAAELIGMSIGSIFLGRVADGIGRRPTMLLCILIMTIGMGAIYYTQTTSQIILVRVITGIGIGGMLACTNAMVAEFANEKNKALSIMFMAAGYPLGIVFGGLALNWLGIDMSKEWRHIFVFGAIASAVMIPAILFLLPESVAYLSRKRTDGSLVRINSTLGRMGHEQISELPQMPAEKESEGFAALFREGMAVKTILLTIAYFSHILVFYFILKWIPKLVVLMNQADPNLNAVPGDVLVWMSVGGATSSILLGLLTRRLNLWMLTFATLVGSVAAVTYFGLGHNTIPALSIAAAVAGFFTNAVIVALYAIFAVVYPPKSRAGGTGFVIGIGRGGAALAPIVGGALLGTGMGLSIVSMIIATGSLVALVSLIALWQIMKREPSSEVA